LVALAVLAVFGLAEATAYVGVYVESPVEIPPLAYFNGTHYKPVYVYYVAKWEEAAWFGEVVKIPVWDFKRAVVFIPEEAFKAKTPPRPLGVLEVAVEGKKALLVEAPDEVLTAYGYLKEAPAEAKRANATWIRQPTKRGPGDKPTPQPRDAKREPEPLGPERSGPEPLDIGSTSSVNPDGAFIFNKTTQWMSASSVYCLNVRRLTLDKYSPPDRPSLAVLGYNASWIWRTAWYVYTPSAPLGQVVGRGLIRVYETTPDLRNAVPLDTQWSVDLRNGYVTFITSISLPSSWSTKHLALELCFQPSITGHFTLGANATVGFKKAPVRIADGNYLLGAAKPASPNTPDFDSGAAGRLAKTILLGPYALADGYYSAVFDWHIVAEVPWPTSSCPTFKIDVYIGDKAHMWIDSAYGTLLSYSGGKCLYEVKKSTTLSTTLMGTWYDEARARDAAVFIRFSLSHQASKIWVYTATIRGQRFAENYPDKPYREWTRSVLRGFYSITPRRSQVNSMLYNGTAPVFVNMYIYHELTGTVFKDLVNVYMVATRGNREPRISTITLYISPSSAYKNFAVFYGSQDRYEEPWWVSMFFTGATIVKTALDLLGAIPGLLSYAIDIILDVRNAAWSGASARYTSDGRVEITWITGYAEWFKYVGIALATSETIDHTIQISKVEVVGADGATYSTDPHAISITLPFNVQLYNTVSQSFRHWAYGMRYIYDTPMIIN